MTWRAHCSQFPQAPIHRVRIRKRKEIVTFHNAFVNSGTQIACRYCLKFRRAHKESLRIGIGKITEDSTHVFVSSSVSTSMRPFVFGQVNVTPILRERT